MTLDQQLRQQPGPQTVGRRADATAAAAVAADTWRKITRSDPLPDPPPDPPPVSSPSNKLISSSNLRRFSDVTFTSSF